MASRIFRRWTVLLATALGILYGLYSFKSISRSSFSVEPLGFHSATDTPTTSHGSDRKWRNIPLRYPIEDFTQIPKGKPGEVPRIQHDFSKYRESPMRSEERQRRRVAIKDAFEHSWKGYKDHAWLHDEVMPLSGQAKDPFGGWGATLVDSLDTLWIMGLEEEFKTAVSALDQIDFTASPTEILNVFETIIRYIGGLLGAYDISESKYPTLLQKAVELGEMVYHAFDTPNHMPVSRWNWKATEAGESQVASSRMLIAELGSLSLEFTRLTQLTGDPKYYDAVQRITQLLHREQQLTRLPGLWPTGVNASGENLHDGVSFTLGGMADSVYEYLPKQYLLLEGRDTIYWDMYLAANDALKRYLVYEPLIPLQRAKKRPSNVENKTPSTSGQPSGDTPLEDIYARQNLRARGYEFSPDYSNPLLLGTSTAYSANEITLDTEGQHLACFAGGMTSLGLRAFAPHMNVTHIDEDIDVAERLTAGCVWAYRNTATGIAPEIFHTTPCRMGRAAVASGDKNETDWTGEKPKDCRWNRGRWMEALRYHHIKHIDAQSNALAESEDPERWEHFIEEHNIEEGFVEVNDARYLLRPEAIESVFILWRTTGDPKYQDQAWEMFSAINAFARTSIGFASLADVTRVPDGKSPPSPEKRGIFGGGGAAPPPSTDPAYIDSMESFWTAETLKYFYLMFADAEVMSLDEFVLNTEAHPFRWRKEAPPVSRPDVYKHYGNNE